MYEDHIIRRGLETFQRAQACVLEIGLDRLYEEHTTCRGIFLLLDNLGYRDAGNLNQAYVDDGRVVFLDAVFRMQEAGYCEQYCRG